MYRQIREQSPARLLGFILGGAAALVLLYLALEAFMWVAFSFLFPMFCWLGGSEGMACNPFLQRGLAAGVFIGVTGPLIGAYVVNRQMALIGEALAHTAFAGVAVGLLLGSFVEWADYPLVTAVIVAVLAALGLQYLATHTDAYGDVPLAILLTGSFAFGLAIISTGVGFGRTVNSYLFGSILTVTYGDVRLMAGLSAVVIVTVALTHKQLLFITFDREAARLARINVRLYDTLLIVLTALVVVAAMQILGAILVAAMLVVPVAAAMQLVDSFDRMLLLSVAVGEVAVVGGILVSGVLGAASGPMIVLTAIAIYLGCLAVTAR